MGLSELAAVQGIDKPVTAWVEAWRAGRGKITKEGINRVTEVMRNDVGTDRRSDGRARLRPSMIGNPCQRAQLLSYLGAPKKDPVEIYVQMADAGSWLHYKWQAEGLSAGWLTDVEVQIEIPGWGLRGSADGIMKDGSIFELKTVGNDKFYGRRGGKSVSDWAAPNPEHVRQVDAYMYATGARAASIVYVNRDSNAFREFRVNWDEERFQELDSFVQGMLASIRQQQLPAILPGCARVMAGDVLEGCTKAEAAAWQRQHDWCDFHESCEHAVWAGVHPVGRELMPWV